MTFYSFFSLIFSNQLFIISWSCAFKDFFFPMNRGIFSSMLSEHSLFGEISFFSFIEPEDSPLSLVFSFKVALLSGWMQSFMVELLVFYSAFSLRSFPSVVGLVKVLFYSSNLLTTNFYFDLMLNNYFELLKAEKYFGLRFKSELSVDSFLFYLVLLFPVCFGVYKTL